MAEETQDPPLTDPVPEQTSDIFDFYDSDHCFGKEMEQFFVSNEFFDAQIKIGGKYYPVHKVILSACSPVFGRLFSERWTEKNVYSISDSGQIDPEVVKDLLCYIYTGRVILTVNNAYSLCVAAHYLQLSKLLSACEQFLSGKVCLQTACSFFKVSLTIGLPKLQQSVNEFVRQNAQKFFQISEALDFSFVQLKTLFDGVKSDEEVFKLNQFYFVASWLKESIDSRKDHLPELFESMELKKLSHKLLTTKIINHPAIYQAHSSSRYLNDTFAQFLTKPADTPDGMAGKLFGFECYAKNDTKMISPMASYDFATKVWTELAAMPVEKYEFACSSIDSEIFTAGGISTDDKAMSCFHKFSNGEWTALEALPFRHEAFAMTSLNGYIYISGGRDCSFQDSSSLYRYCPLTNQWHCLKSMRASRANHKLVVLAGLLYAVAGDGLRTVEKYNPRTDEWEYVQSLDRIFIAMDVIVFKNALYLYGDTGLLKYCPNANEWTTISSFDAASDLIKSDNETKFLSLEERLFVIDYRPIHEESASWPLVEFDLTSNEWINRPEMDIVKHFKCSIGFYSPQH